MTWEQLPLFENEYLGLQGLEKAAKTVASCYLCQGTGLLQSDEECACVEKRCGCKECMCD